MQKEKTENNREEKVSKKEETKQGKVDLGEMWEMGISLVNYWLNWVGANAATEETQCRTEPITRM